MDASGRRLASAGLDSTIRIWNLDALTAPQAPKLLAAMTRHDGTRTKIPFFYISFKRGWVVCEVVACWCTRGLPGLGSRRLGHINLETRVRHCILFYLFKNCAGDNSVAELLTLTMTNLD